MVGCIVPSVASAPSGVTLYAVGLGLAGGGLAGPVTVGMTTPAVTYTIP